jgi:hypothetical protein
VVESRKAQGKCGTAAVRDYQTQLEKLRKDAAECKLISEFATDQPKRELFDRLAKHLSVLATQVEEEMLHRNLKATDR